MHNLLPALAAAATSIFVGTTMVATKYVIAQSDPASLALMRYVIGFLCLLPLVIVAARPKVQMRDLLPVALLGIGQFGILIALLNYGLQHIPAARGALIFATLPLLTMLLAAILGQEKLTPLKTLGVLLCLLGVGLALSQKLGSASLGGEWLGELSVFASALCGAICSVFYRPYLQRYPALHIGAFAMLASVAFLVLPAGVEGFFETMPAFTTMGWSAIVFIGVSSGIGYYLWLWALQNTTPTRVTIFLALSPITATALGAVLLSEEIGAKFLAGLACVAVGITLAHFRASPA